MFCSILVTAIKCYCWYITMQDWQNLKLSNINYTQDRSSTHQLHPTNINYTQPLHSSHILYPGQLFLPGVVDLFIVPFPF